MPGDKCPWCGRKSREGANSRGDINWSCGSLRYGTELWQSAACERRGLLTEIKRLAAEIKDDVDCILGPAARKSEGRRERAMLSEMGLTYQDCRDEMRTGDQIVFSGRGPIARFIKRHSAVTHTSSVIRVCYTTRTVSGHGGIPRSLGGRYECLNLIVEAVLAGVQVVKLDTVMENFEGEAWWLPLNHKLRRERFDEGKFLNWMFAQIGKPYDIRQGLRSILDKADEEKGWTYNYEDFARFFCSEYSAGGLEESGLTGPVNASEAGPDELCRWAIYEPMYFQLLGDVPVEIEGYNTVPPK